MPFKSKKQRKWMHANKPKMAKKWEKESVKEGDLGPTTKKGKTVKAVHKKSGKEIVVVDTPASRKKLKRMGFKVESVNEAKGNVVVIDRKYIPKIAHVRKVLKLKMGKDLSVYKTDSNNVYHKVSDSQIKRFLDRLDRFDVKYKLGESVNEAIEPSGIMAKINKIVQDKQAAKIDGVLMDMFSASIMMRIFNAVNDKSKKDMNKGTMRQVKVILHKVMKQNKVRK